MKQVVKIVLACCIFATPVSAEAAQWRDDDYLCDDIDVYTDYLNHAACFDWQYKHHHDIVVQKALERQIERHPATGYSQSHLEAESYSEGLAAEGDYHRAQGAYDGAEYRYQTGGY